VGTVRIGDSFQTCDLCKGPRGENFFYSMTAIEYRPGTGKRYEYDEICGTCWASISVVITERRNVNVAAAREKFKKMAAQLHANASYDEAAKGR